MRGSPGLWLAIGYLLLLVVIALFGSLLAPYDPIVQNIPNRHAPFSLVHWLGTDEIGRDVASRLMWGARPALLIQREPGSMTRLLFERAHAAPLPPSLVVGSREALKEAVAAGLGQGLLFEGETAHDPRLAFVPFCAPEVSAVVCAVALREMRDVPAVAAFLGVASSSRHLQG